MRYIFLTPKEMRIYRNEDRNEDIQKHPLLWVLGIYYCIQEMKAQRHEVTLLAHSHLKLLLNMKPLTASLVFPTLS